MALRKRGVTLQEITSHKEKDIKFKKCGKFEIMNS